MDSVSGIYSVASFGTYKPYQFRLLIPLFFLALKPLGIIATHKVLGGMSFIITYLIIVVHFRILCEYITNKKAALVLALLILYPMSWNYILLNQSFLYYDFAAILFFSLGLYFILKDNFPLLLLTFLAGLINKETIAYLVIAYILYNYRHLFTRKIIQNIAIFALIFLIYKLALNYMFRANPGDTFEICFMVNLWIFEDLLANSVYTRDIFLNFGGLYVFALLLFITGRWKQYADRRKLYLNLTFFVYMAAGIVIIYISEVRVYTELMPMVSVLFVIYLSTFKKLNLQQVSINGR